MKRRLTAFLILAAACFALAGCTDGRLSPSGSSGGNTEATLPNPPTGSGEQLSPPDTADKQEITAMYILINGNKLEATLAENSAVNALVERLKQGDITYAANDYGGFEKVGNLGFSLPAEDTQITTQAGDVILYSGNQIVLFYGSNTWAYTRIGKINGYSAAQLSSLLGAGNGNVQVTISLK